jgi:hypothetical protein
LYKSLAADIVGCFFKQARKAASHSEAKSIQIIQQINMIGLIYLVMRPVIISFDNKKYKSTICREVAVVLNPIHIRLL